MGNIVARNLRIVTAPGLGELDVLGMNFLSKLEFLARRRTNPDTGAASSPIRTGPGGRLILGIKRLRFLTGGTHAP